MIKLYEVVSVELRLVESPRNETVGNMVCKMIDSILNVSRTHGRELRQKTAQRACSGGDFTRRQFVNITPDPIFAAFDRAHDGMLGVMEMFRCMLVLRRIAAGNVSADKTHAQMDPGVAGLHAVFATVALRLPHFNLIEMRAFLGHWQPPSYLSFFSLPCV
jgi:hypothetical protein